MRLTLTSTFTVILLAIANECDFVNSSNKDDFLYGKFPKGFKFGLSTASYQIEGGFDADGKGPSIWDDFTHQDPSPIFDHSNADISADSYHKYEEDVKLLKDLGVTSYRFSLSWPRLLPLGTTEVVNENGVDYYDKLINLLIQNGIEPIVTLYHWDLPSKLQEITGGWTSEDMIPHFVSYSEFAFSRFGDRVKTWLTFNEGWVFCLNGYGFGNFAPGIKNMSDFPYLCAHTVIKSHAKAYRIYDEKFREKFGGKIGIVIDSGWFEPASTNPQDVEAAERARQFKFGMFASPLFYGKYPDVVREYVDKKSKAEGLQHSRLPTFDKKWSQIIKGTVDFIGLNHYTSELVSAKPRSGSPSWFTDQDLSTFYDESWPKSASIWLRVVPWGFRKILNWIKETYGNPEILITETGFSDPVTDTVDDDDRINYFKQYTNQLLKAVVIDGCNVVGCLYWSLLDNFEWQRGFSERFGVHYVNYSDPQRTRTPKKSAAFLKKLFSNNGFVNPNEDRSEL